MNRAYRHRKFVLLRGISLSLSLFLLHGCAISSNADLVEEWKHEHDSAFSAFRNNDFEKAQLKYNKAIAVARRIQPEDPRVARTLNGLALVFRAKGDLVGALNAYKEAIRGLPERMTKSPDDRSLLEAYGDSLHGMANVEEQLGHNDLAAASYQKCVEVAEKGRFTSLMRDLQSEYVSFLEKNGDSVRANDVRNELTVAMAAASPVVGNSRLTAERFDDLMISGAQFEKRGDKVSAEHAYERAWALAVSSEKPKLQGDAAKALGLMKLSSKEFRDAEKWLLQSVECYERDTSAATERHHAFMGLTQALISQGRYDEALRTANGAVSNAKAITLDNSPQLTEALSAAAGAAVKNGSLTEATRYRTVAYELSLQEEPIHSPTCTLNLCYAANLRWLSGDREGARKLVDRHTDKLMNQPPQNLVVPGRLLTEYAAVVSKSGHAAEAIVFYSAAKKVLENSLDRGPVYKQACAGLCAATNSLKMH